MKGGYKKMRFVIISVMIGIILGLLTRAIPLLKRVIKDISMKPKKK